VGKTYLAKELVSRSSKNCMIVCPTHTACNKYDKAETLHSFLGIDIHGKKTSIRNYSKIDRVILDECSMVGVELFTRLVCLSQQQPHIQFILVGDFKQLEPVNSYSSLDMWKYFIHFHYELHECKRAEDQETFQINKKLRDGDIVSASMFKTTNDICKNEVNLCHTNDQRRIINNACIKKYSVGKNIHKIEFKQIAKPESPEENEKVLRSQELHTLYEGLPVILLKTILAKGETPSLYNGYKFKIENFEVGKHFSIRSDRDQIYTLEWSRLKDFVPCYAMTVHKAQGETLKDPYVIHGYHRMSPTMKYVAVSRCQAISQISICNLVL